MPLYTAELDLLKRELVELRKFNLYRGYEGDELTLSEYAEKKYILPEQITKYIKHFVHEQEKDVMSFSRHSDSYKATNRNKSFDAFVHDELEYSEGTEAKVNQTATTATSVEDKQETANYFSAPELELSFDRVKFKSYHKRNASREVETEESIALRDLDKIFQHEMARIKELKASLALASVQMKVAKVYDKVKQGKLNEASVLISRFYNENKQDITIGYLYFEILFAKAATGNQKSLAKAREVANNVCFLRDKTDEDLLLYYRYIYVCREYAHDIDKALQLLRDFVLITPDKFISQNAISHKDGLVLKCLLLFMRFDVASWNSYEAETMQEIVSKTIAGGIWYIAFLRKDILKLAEAVRFEKFTQVETDLYNLKRSHNKLMDKIKSNFQTNGLPNGASNEMHTVGQIYLQKFFKVAKLPSFVEYLSNVSVMGTMYLENTKNDNKLMAKGLDEHFFWRMWISRITDESSLQRSDILPIEQVIKEAKLLAKYESIATKAFNYEKEIFDMAEYDDYRNLLPDITQKGILSVMLGENKYSVFDYGLPWTGIRDFYNNINSVNNPEHQLASSLILKKGKLGIIWNLEELQMLLESLNLIIDSKTLGIKARLDAIKNSRDENYKNQEQYMSLSEHLELYWWLYILLVSLCILLFNLII